MQAVCDKQLICKSRDSMLLFFCSSLSRSCLLLRILLLFCPFRHGFVPRCPYRWSGMLRDALRCASSPCRPCASRLDHVVLRSTLFQNIRLEAHLILSLRQAEGCTRTFLLTSCLLSSAYLETKRGVASTYRKWPPYPDQDPCAHSPP